MYKMNEIADIYVKDDDKNIYKVTSHEQCSSKIMCYVYRLNLICGWDYINDENDTQGYVSDENFIDDIQSVLITVYPLEETLKDRLEEEGYIIINKLPFIYK